MPIFNLYNYSEEYVEKLPMWKYEVTYAAICNYEAKKSLAFARSSRMAVNATKEDWENYCNILEKSDFNLIKKNGTVAGGIKKDENGFYTVPVTVIWNKK